jgi:hypothetical protein
MKRNMKRYRMILVWLFIFKTIIPCPTYCQSSENIRNLKVILIRHAEKPAKGDNLTCQGLHRSLQLPDVLVKKFGVPNYTYVPTMGQGDSTKHSRMFQTVIPLAAKYNLTINSKFDEKDSSGLAEEVRKKDGTVLIVWEHRAIASIVRSLGVHDFSSIWGDADYESIWIISFPNGIATVTKEKEGLTPDNKCAF